MGNSSSKKQQSNKKPLLLLKGPSKALQLFSKIKSKVGLSKPLIKRKFKVSNNVAWNIFKYFEDYEKIAYSLINKSFKKANEHDVSNRTSFKLCDEYSLIYFLNNLKLLSNLQILHFKGINFFEFSFINKIFKIKEKLENLTELSISDSVFSQDMEKLFNSLISSKCLNTIKISHSNLSFMGFMLISTNLENCKNLKELSIISCNMDEEDYRFRSYESSRKSNFGNLFSLSNLETLNLSHNLVNNLTNEIFKSLDSFPKLTNLILRNCDVEQSSIEVNHIFNESKLEFIDLSENFFNNSNCTRILSRILPNNKIQLLCELPKHVKPVVNNRPLMRMLFSRSGIVVNDPLNKTGTIQENDSNPIGKFMSFKPNMAILPNYIYDSPSKIEFSKDELIQILLYENYIRLSKEAKTLYDINKHSDAATHLKLDKEIILEALRRNGYSPGSDDSLKAYHIATNKFIHDEEVRDSVVWMKYDKCKIGTLKRDDQIDFSVIYISEAHALDEWPLSHSDKTNQHKNIQERISAAKQVSHNSVPLYCDSFGESSFEGRFAAWPERAFIVQNNTLKYISQHKVDGTDNWHYKVMQEIEHLIFN